MTDKKAQVFPLELEIAEIKEGTAAAVIGGNTEGQWIKAEIINNDNIKLRNKGSQSINIVGIDSEDNGNINIEQAYNNIPKLSYTITLCHTPDTVVKIEKNLTDLYLSGQSLGGQAYFIFDSLYKPDFTSLYYRGKHTIDDKVKVDISSGTGTVIEDVRFLSNAEIVIYTLKHKQFQDNTALPE